MFFAPSTPICITLNNHHGIWATVAIGALSAREWSCTDHHVLSSLPAQPEQWIYHVLSYDLKNHIENLSIPDHKIDRMPARITVIPEVVIRFQVDGDTPGFLILQGTIHSELSRTLYSVMAQIRAAYHGQRPDPIADPTHPMSPTITREAYLERLENIAYHLRRGDIYEVNFCQEFKSTKTLHQPFETWLDLLQKTAAPFAAFLAYNDWVLLCASPERFLMRRGNRLISQPIKGTKRRDTDRAIDEALKAELKSSPKDRSENIMIVDLVRNDLSRIACRDSVRVSELCGAYSFKTVHHLISTIEAEIPENTTLEEILRATFPMGSMTGAPKISAMQIAENLENFRRGWYAGSIGFVAPNGDFDLNVIIRSAVYNRSTHEVMCGVGGAITIASDYEQEYEESLLKARALRETI